jgi:hypothetical protein
MTNGSRIKKLQENQIRNGRGEGVGKDYKPSFKLMIIRLLLKGGLHDT